MSAASIAVMKSRQWIAYFQRNRQQPPLPWDDTYRLSREERAAVARSVQQFQLGEGARGRGLLRRAEAYARRAGDPQFVSALRLFIAEEQRHSADLARFLTQQGIAVRPAHWVDTTFRKLRKGAGLEVCVGVLVTAELIAVPYYRALRDATESPLLRVLCRRILCDEAQHLRFQAATLARLRWQRPWLLRRATMIGHQLFLLGTALVVWCEHRSAFCRGGYWFNRFISECLRLLRGLDSQVEQEIAELAISNPTTALDVIS